MGDMSTRALDLATPSTRGNSFITDIAVLFLLDSDPWLPTAAWVRMLVALDLPAATARTSLHRMDKGGYLDRTSHAGVPGYAMSERWREFVHSAQTLPQPDVETQTRWALVTFSIPETQRDLRHTLRSLLERSSMAPLGNGTWIGPEVVVPALEQLVQTLGLSGYVDCFLAENRAFRDDDVALARRCWDLDTLQRNFAAFEADADVQLARPDVTDDEAFVTVVTMHNAWRRLETRAPALPARMLPAGGSRPASEAALDRLLTARLPAARFWVASLRV
jgi:phenylacetic acid degradation operon negative regulatory protein